MYKDIISYKLAEGVVEEHLFKIAGEIVKSWMRSQPGFISWEIHKNNDGGYTDIVCWESEENAKKATTEMVNIPNANDWYACYEKDSTSGYNLVQLKKFG